MLSHIFVTVLLLSCVGGALSLVLLALKPITKRIFGSRWQYYIWLAVLVVMVLPVTINLGSATPEQTSPPQAIQVNNAQTIPQTDDILETDAQPYFPIQQTISETLNNITIGAYDLIIYAWLLGALLFFASCLIKYWLFIGAIRKNSILISCPDLNLAMREMKMKNSVRVRSTNCINAPLMVGVFKPTLVLPDTETARSELHYILLHELTHLKRRDIWCKWFAMFVNAVHWFNPLIYLVVRQINIECEISCDLALTQNMTEQEKNHYMNTILALISGSKPKEPLLTTAMASNTKQIKTRFMMIRKSKKASSLISVISMILAILVVSSTVFASGVLAGAVNDSSAISFGNNAPMTELNGGIMTYFEAGHSLEENVRHTLGGSLIDKNGELTTTIRQSAPYYIDKNGKKIAHDYKGTIAYGVYLDWIENSEDNRHLIYKTVVIEGRTINVGFTDQALAYMDDKVINKMIETQIAFELGVGYVGGYDHTAFIDELIKTGIYVILEVVEPQNIQLDLHLSVDSTYVFGRKPLTVYDSKTKASDIFSGKVEMPQNSDVSQGLQLGDSFTVSSGETLVIDIKGASSGLNKIHWAIIDAVTGNTVKWMPNAPCGERWIFIPLDGMETKKYILKVSAEESGWCDFEVFTYQTDIDYRGLIADN